ncbi:hypothetical protein L2E82_33478 [Cichorium intybus]|uniref:Uncharacterized protein n=1 Tax=Cichorium intybus TaxID=13427 RepID=A0ACB9BKA5_CICIN|nr:hypothetical protein L2E82_33478 [Cichorium intybus]
MATPGKETPVDANATSKSVSISGPAYKVTVGGTARGKPRRYTVSTTSQTTVIEQYHVGPRYLRPSNGSCHDSCKHGADELGNIRRLGVSKKYTMSTSRYLKPSTGSCHDSCKHGSKDESVELKTTRTLASRKKAVTKNNGVKRTVVTVERKKITGTKPNPTRDPKIRAPGNELKIHSRVKTKPMTVKPSSSTLKNKKVTKNTSQGSKNRNAKLASPRKDQYVMTKAKLRQLIAEKIQEMTLQEAETEEVGVEETIQSPESVTTESTIVQNSEEVFEEDSSSGSIQSSSIEQVSESNEQVSESNEQASESNEQVSESNEQVSESNEQVLESESEHADEDVGHEEILEEEIEYDEEGFIMEGDEDEMENDDNKPRRHRVVRSDGKDGPGQVKFRRGRVLDVDEEGESEKVNLKHQEVGKKEAQELLNSVIEETASKLVGDMKTKVEALVGAFETVISRLDEAPSSE